MQAFKSFDCFTDRMCTVAEQWGFVGQLLLGRQLHPQAMVTLASRRGCCLQGCWEEPTIRSWQPCMQLLLMLQLHPDAPMLQRLLRVPNKVCRRHPCPTSPSY